MQCNEVSNALLAAVAVAIMASRASAAPNQGQGWARGPAVTRFVCAHCTATSQLRVSSSGLLLSRAVVHCHIAASKPCFIAKQGHREIQAAARPCDCMARVGAGGCAGLPAPDVRHRPPGEGQCEDFTMLIKCQNVVTPRR
jgi:hypothetical protein